MAAAPPGPGGRDASGARRASPSVARNRDGIRDAFARMAIREGRVLEIASGTGEHGVHITAGYPGLVWQPSDPDAEARASITAWAEAAQGRVLAPLALDVMRPRWWEGLGPIDAVCCINMIHIAPWEAALGLFDGASALLEAGGRVFLYGPFRRNGEHTAPSNAAFDASLKARNPLWGVRDLEGDLIPAAEARGFRLADRLAMPANNVSVVFERAG